MSQVVVYVNPVAGGGRASRVWRRLTDCEARLGAVRTVIPERVRDAGAALDEALGPGVTRLIAIGGDGTANLVANHLLAKGDAHRIAFGLVPAGTGSDLARTLGLPRSPAAAWSLARSAEPKRMDAIKVVRDDGLTRFAINIASVGISGAVDLATSAIARRSALSYLRVSVQTLLRYRPVACRLLLDGNLIFDGPFFVTAFANGRCFGGGMRVAPDACLDDGLADVVVVPPVPRWALPLRLPQFLRGRHVRLPMVCTARGRSLRIEPHDSDRIPPFDLDGEVLAAGAATLTLLPKVLRVAV